MLLSTSILFLGAGELAFAIFSALLKLTQPLLSN
jgi:hypothetical protein